ncbi:MAG: PAS domain S-box protein [Candidatus Freyarchaeum deiterrae]
MVGLKKSEVMKKLLSEAEVLDQLGDAIIAVDNDDIIVYLNKAAAQLYNVARDEAIGLKLTDLYEDLWLTPKDKQAAHASLEEKDYWDARNIHIKKNGKRMPARSMVSIIRDASGKKIGKILIPRDTTEWRRIEDALRQSEKQFRTLAENSPLTITRWDRDLRYVYITPAVKNLTGLPPEFFIGKNIEEIGVAPKDIIKINAKILNEVFATGQPQTREFSFPSPTGTKLLHWHIVPEFADDGTVETALSFTTDITSRKQMEEKLAKERNMLRGIMENTQVMLAYLDTNFNFVAVNSAYAKGSGHSVEELIGKNHFSLFPNEENQAIFELVNVSGEAVEYHDKPFEFADQPERGITYWDWKLAPVKDDEGRVLGLVLSLTETTQRKKAEDALKESEERNRIILESITDGFVAFDREWRYTYVNVTAEKMLHKTKKELLGQEVWEMFPDAVKRKFWLEFNRAVRELIPVHFEEFYPEPLNAWYECHCYPTPDGLTVIFTDITKRKQMEENLKEYTLHLEELVKERTAKLQESERLAAIGETAGMVGHDIRNPLQTIIGEVYLAGNELDSMPEGEAKKILKENLEAIEGQVTYINKIVSDLQDFGRPLKPSTEEIDSQQLIQNSLSIVAVPENIQVSKLIEKDSPKLTADPSYMKRVLTNMITNAIQAMPKGGKLTIKVFHKDKSAFITIEDTGEGIPEEIKPNMFKPLFTTKAKGQGFGLAVCKRLVEAQNGAITFESQIGKGTSFTIELPLQTKK